MHVGISILELYLNQNFIMGGWGGGWDQKKNQKMSDQALSQNYMKDL